MSKSKTLALTCLVLLLGTLGCSSDTVSNTDPVAAVQAQLNQWLPFVTALLQDLNPFNPPPPPSPTLGFTPACPPQKELDQACNVSGSASCSPSGPDFVYDFVACTSEASQVGVTISLVIDGSLTYLASEGENGWPTGARTVDFDGGSLGEFFFDVLLDGTKDAVIVATVLGGLQARCCADLDADFAECYDMDAGEDVCEPKKGGITP